MSEVIIIMDPPYGIDAVKTNRKVGPGGVLGFNGKKGKNIPSKEYNKIKGDNTTETAKKAYGLCVDIGIENYIIWGGNYFTDFLPVSSCWIVWDKENGDNQFADVEIAWSSYKQSSKLYKWLWNGLARKSELTTRVHPTQKPVGLHADIIKDFTNEDDIIMDLFLGSGSTLIAAEQTNRICYGMELDEKYCDVIISRWETFTGLTAIRPKQ